MEFRHVPVLLNSCIKGLNIKPDGVYVDGTIGGGGHSYYICEQLSAQGTLIGIDRDSDALKAAGERLRGFSCRRELIQGDYADIRQILSGIDVRGIDGALLDIGVSSYQLDNPERGFSYMHDAPLDMRMDRNSSLTAYDVVNTYSRNDLARIISDYGEERWAARIASFIEGKRKEAPIRTTSELVDVIKSAIPASARRAGPHPAKRTFQAIRIEVNDELTQLADAVDEYLDVMNPGGRLAIITFHSLEDRIVKEKFQKRANPCTCPPEFPVCVCGKVADVRKVTKKPLVADEGELAENPRSRSAKLRICEKL